MSVSVPDNPPLDTNESVPEMLILTDLPESRFVAVKTCGPVTKNLPLLKTKVLITSGAAGSDGAGRARR